VHMASLVQSRACRTRPARALHVLLRSGSPSSSHFSVRWTSEIGKLTELQREMDIRELIIPAANLARYESWRSVSLLRRHVD